MIREFMNFVAEIGKPELIAQQTQVQAVVEIEHRISAPIKSWKLAELTED
jgi:hypothetical protein